MLATARTPVLDGNLLAIHGAIRRLRSDLPVTLLLEPYSYGFVGKLRYMARLIRGMVLLRSSRWFVVDNAFLPVHVMPHRRETTVIQVWHAVGALKRFGWDSLTPLADPERRFLHRHYDWVVCSGEPGADVVKLAVQSPATGNVGLVTYTPTTSSIDQMNVPSWAATSSPPGPA